MSCPTTMKRIVAAVALLAATCPMAMSQVVLINEVVEDEQDFETSEVPDTREFVELYNPGATAVDLTGWQLGLYDLATGSNFIVDTLPGGSSIPGGGYFVIGAAAVPNVNYTPAAGELWQNGATIFELRRPDNSLADAVGLETFRGVELANATQEQLDQIGGPGQTPGPDARGGWWGQIESNNAHPSDSTYPNLPMSLGRYLDGRDSNFNGRDFGMIPATPGASNNLLQTAAHIVPNVDALAVNSVLRDDYYASFKLPRVIAPGTASVYNPYTIDPSPQGGNAIIAWDETGGGNAAYSDDYVNKFELWAFIDPRPFNVTTPDSNQNEATIYGIGTTDILFSTPNSADLLTGQPGVSGNITSSANGSTGVGWVIQRRTSNVAGEQDSKAVLQLVDFNDGGDGVLADNDWQVITTIDMTGMSEGWHALSVDYDPTTGSVVAKYDSQTFNFDSEAGLVGNFYIGYRENLPGSGGPIARPPTYDLFVAAPDNDADFNNDGEIDGQDFLIWQRGLGPGTNATGDANGDGQVNGADLDIWKAAYASATPVAGAVPEPASGLTAAGAVAALLARRKRRGACHFA